MVNAFSAVVAAVLLCSPPVVITRRDLPPLAEATDGVLGTLGGSAVVLDLAELDPQAAARTLRELAPSVVIAVGRSALQVAIAAGSGALVVYTMVNSPADQVAAPVPAGVSGTRIGPDPTLVYSTLSSLRPGASRVLVLYDPARSRHLLAEHRAAAAAAGVKLVAVATPDRAAVARALLSPPKGIDAICFLLDVTVLYPEAVDQLIRIGAARRLPVVGLSAEHCAAGALFAIVAEPAALGRQAAEAAAVVIRERKGAGQAWPRAPRLLVNGAVAQRLGVTVPPRVGELRVERCGSPRP